MKKRIICLLTAVVCLNLVFSANITFARGRKSPSASPRPTPVVSTSDRLTALSLTSVIVTIYATHLSKEYKVTPATKIVINGQPGTLSGLAAGMDVAVTTLPNDATTAALVEAKTPARW